MIVRLGTTRGTNALLTRRGATNRVRHHARALADVLAIGYQNRPRLFDLAIRKRDRPLLDRGRDRRAQSRPHGQVLRAGRSRHVRRQLERAAAAPASIRWPSACCTPIALPNTSSSSRELAREVGFNEISVSSQRGAAGQDRRPWRHDGDGRLFESDLARLRGAAARARSATADLRIMTSAGGLVAADQFSRQGQHSLRTRRRRRRLLARGASRPASPRRSASTWEAPAPTSRASTVATSWNTKPRRRACASSRR